MAAGIAENTNECSSPLITPYLEKQVPTSIEAREAYRDRIVKDYIDPHREDLASKNVIAWQSLTKKFFYELPHSERTAFGFVGLGPQPRHLLEGLKTAGVVDAVGGWSGLDEYLHSLHQQGQISTSDHNLLDRELICYFPHLVLDHEEIKKRSLERRFTAKDAKQLYPSDEEARCQVDTEYVARAAHIRYVRTTDFVHCYLDELTGRQHETAWAGMLESFVSQIMAGCKETPYSRVVQCIFGRPWYKDVLRPGPITLLEVLDNRGMIENAGGVDELAALIATLSKTKLIRASTAANFQKDIAVFYHAPEQLKNRVARIEVHSPDIASENRWLRDVLLREHEIHVKGPNTSDVLSRLIRQVQTQGYSVKDVIDTLNDLGLGAAAVLAPRAGLRLVT